MRLDTFHHYQDVKDKLGKIFKQLGGQTAAVIRCYPGQCVMRLGAVLSVAIVGLCLYAQRAVQAQSQATLPQLVDITASTGIRFKHLASPDKKYIVESMSGGVALIDYDRDGWPDIYFTNAPDVDMQLAGKKARSALFHNNHDGTFTDVTDKAGVAYPCWANGAVGRRLQQ